MIILQKNLIIEFLIGKLQFKIMSSPDLLARHPFGGIGESRILF